MRLFSIPALPGARVPVRGLPLLRAPLPVPAGRRPAVLRLSVVLPQEVRQVALHEMRPDQEQMTQDIQL